MALKILSELKKDKKVHKETFYCPHLIVGHDISSLMTFEFLRQKFGEENVKFLLPHSSALDDFFLPGPSLLRGTENQQLVQSLFPDCQIQLNSEVCKFSKDQTFYSFNNKIRPPTKVLPFEEFFTRPGASLNPNSLFPLVTQSPQCSQYQSACITETLLAISLSINQHWELQGASGRLYNCENLYFSSNLKTFYQLLQNKDILSLPSHELFLKTENSSCFIISFEGHLQIGTQLGTLFLPQSLTHDWGYFIGEFQDFDPIQKIQKFSFLSFVSEIDSNPEEISKKIRLLKRSIRKHFPKFLKAKLNEKILITDKIPISRIQDHFYQDLKKELDNLYFLGMEAPLSEKILTQYNQEKNTSFTARSISHLARSLFSFYQITQSYTDPV